MIEHDEVNHPGHYTNGDIECIDAIRAALSKDGFIAYCRGNAIKYLWRTGLKDASNPVVDLQKANWYINAAINAHNEEDNGKQTD